MGDLRKAVPPRKDSLLACTLSNIACKILTCRYSRTIALSSPCSGFGYYYFLEMRYSDSPEIKNSSK
jgi:hypothetical protein